MTSDRNPTAIDDSVIEALQPQSQRYDVSIDDDMVLSVLPNGVKTWTWVYDDPADPHRKTLGIYPDMSLDDAKKSLASEKAAYRRAADENATPEFVVRDGRIQPAEPSSSQLPIIAGAVAVALIIALVAWFFFGRGGPDTPAGESPAAQPDRRGEPAQTAQPARDDAVRTPARAAPVDAGADAPVADMSDSAAAEIESQVAAINERLEAELERLRALEQAEPEPVPEPVRPATATAPVPPQPAPASAPARPEPANPTGGQPRPAPPEPAPVSTRPEPATPATAAQAAAPTVRPQSPETGQFGAPAGPVDLLLDSRVARGNLTTAVVRREPVDDLGSNILGTGEDMQTYFFFTELRELSGQRIRHRWVQGERIIADVPFDVGDAWRWRVYSSKTFLPSMAGPWRVQVVLDDDTVIYSLPFTFTP